MPFANLFTLCFPHAGTTTSVDALSSIDMYNNDVGKRFMKQTGALKDATLYFASSAS
jgi:hypothetical protein